MSIDSIPLRPATSAAFRSEPGLIIRLVLFLVLLAASTDSLAGDNVAVASLFRDGAVLQRDMPIPVWGTAPPNTEIQVSFAGQHQSANSSQDGHWTVTLNALEASKLPRVLTVSAGQTQLEVRDVLVGDVWLCSGQSNMAMRVDLARDAEVEKSASRLPELRVFTVQYSPARVPKTDVEGTWVGSSPDTAGRFSACAFFFGRELHRELDIPIGLIVAARSGSDITAWTSQEAQKDAAWLAPLLAAWKEKDDAYTKAVEAAEQSAYAKAISAWQKQSAASLSAGTQRPKKPRQPVNPRDHWHHPQVLFNGMIAPLIPYAIRGSIWYQGETNALTEESSALYEKQLRLLVNDWRTRWNQGNFPFAWVQLPFTSAKQVAWARIRESMRRATDVPNTAMVVTLDLGEERLLHPKNKQAFAHRLALWARANVYGQDIAWSGPMFSGYRVGEKNVLVRFDHHGGLVANNGPLVGFETRDATGRWEACNALIKNNRVVLPISPAKQTNAIRYAWANHPTANLENGAGLPASPFLVEFAAADVPRAIADNANDGGTRRERAKRAPADLTMPPLDPADIDALPESTTRLDVFLLMGQSNMKGRGVMPEKPLRDPRIIMMHRKNDQYYLARHPLHLTGDPTDFSGADNAGVGPGLAFAQSIVKQTPNRRVLLIPCAVGGTAISKWQKGQRLYEETVRRAKLATQQGPSGKTSIAGAIWLQGEADSGSPERIARYADSLDQMIDDLRSDLGIPDLPFIACTIGEMRSDLAARKSINDILLDLPNRRPHTACVDGRSFAKSIGDKVHFDTATQQEHGRRYAKWFLELTKKD